MKRISLAVASALVLGGSAAQAADMALKAPPPPPAPIFSWTGCHLGADVGFAWATDKDRETVTATGAASIFSPFPTNTARPDGAKVGGYLGCDYQFSGGFVIGLEGDAEWADITSIGTNFINTGIPADHYNTRIRSEASVRGRLGYGFNSALFYVTGGGAWANVNETDVIGATGVSQSDSSTRGGWTVGAGVDYAFSNNVIGRIEYRYADFGTFSYAPTLVFPAFTEHHRITENVIRAGLAYKF